MEQCDVILTGGTVIDGSGSAGFKADVAVKGDQIVAVGDCVGWQADQVLDASGQIVSPGFIDVHTHDDVAVIKTPDMPFKISQGVTTIVAGNCGISAAPFTPCDGLPPPFTLNLAEHAYTYPNVDAYRQAVQKAAPAVNVAMLAGHSSLRANVMKTDLNRPATDAEITQMSETLDLALRQGCIGLSSGLDYPPAFEAPMQEMITLAKTLGAHPNSVYTSHMRDEGDFLVQSVIETIETGRQAKANVVISHHKCAGKANYGKSIKTLKIIAEAQKTQKVSLDVYPYVASSTALIQRFVKDATEVKISWSSPHPEMGGRMLDDIANEWGITREEATDRLHPAGAIYFDMDEGDLQRIIAFPTSMIGSDGIPGAEKPHPRLWGTFPRVLGHYARDLGIISLAQAVHKMTGMSAANFGLKDRGLVRQGLKADLVIFDADTVIDTATFDDPERPAKGISHVLVNGQVSLTGGTQTRIRAGQFVSH
ncbi:MAG: N-acyl-D-amino-acid deacylase [Paracoccaceae bacterium]|jgi:N-acyl-D-amino-acid deacylase